MTPLEAVETVKVESSFTEPASLTATGLSLTPVTVTVIVAVVVVVPSDNV